MGKAEREKTDAGSVTVVGAKDKIRSIDQARGRQHPGASAVVTPQGGWTLRVKNRLLE